MAEIDDFNSLKTAIQGKIKPLNITKTPLDWPVDSRLPMNYAVTVTIDSTLSEVVFNGQNQSKLFHITQPTTWGEGGNSSFLFQNTPLAPSGVSSGGAMMVQAHVTFNNPAIFMNNYARGDGGGIDTDNVTARTITFNNKATFINNYAFSDGGAIDNGYFTVIFNDSATFTKNITEDLGGAIYNAGRITFNNTVTFNNNIAKKQFGGALYLYANSSFTFNAMATFMNNTASSKGGVMLLEGRTEVRFFSSSVFVGNRAPEGGAIHTAGTVIFNNTATFLNNIASNKGGAIYVAGSSGVTLHTTSPSVPSVFSGNKPNAIYFDGAGRLTLDTEVDTLISIQDGIASANSAPTITKQGPGLWRQSGNSTGYGGTTNITAGSLEFEAGTGGYENTVYGNTNSGTFTLGPRGTLAFSNTQGNSPPLLQAATVTLDGGTVTVGLVEPGEGTVILSGSPINGGAFSEGDILNQGQTQFCDWQFVFTSPSEVVLKVKKRS